MNYRSLLCCLLFLTFVGCTPKVNIITSTGEPLPEPHYILKDSDNTIQATFYYSAITEVKDLDGSIQPIPHYLDKNISHFLSTKKYQKLILTMKVFNPKHLEYVIYETCRINKNTSYRYEASKSNLLFRTYEFSLPLGKKIKSVKFYFEIRGSDGRTLMRTGNFNYSTN
jgi:hypothetical protein